MPTVDLQIFSPRWGREDTYSVELERGHMEITMGIRTARATWRDNADPEWTGEPLQRIFLNDHIYQPAITQDLFQKVWTAWRGGDLDDAQADAELQEVATWLNVVTRAKPNTDFWRLYF